MRTHGHIEGKDTLWGLLDGGGRKEREDQEKELGRDSLGRNAKCG